MGKRLDNAADYLLGMNTLRDMKESGFSFGERARYILFGKALPDLVLIGAVYTVFLLGGLSFAAAGVGEAFRMNYQDRVDREYNDRTFLREETDDMSNQETKRRLRSVG